MFGLIWRPIDARPKVGRTPTLPGSKESALLFSRHRTSDVRRPTESTDRLHSRSTSSIPVSIWDDGTGTHGQRPLTARTGGVCMFGPRSGVFSRGGSGSGHARGEGRRRSLHVWFSPDTERERESPATSAQRSVWPTFAASARLKPDASRPPSHRH